MFSQFLAAQPTQGLVEIFIHPDDAPMEVFVDQQWLASWECDVNITRQLLRPDVLQDIQARASDTLTFIVVKWDVLLNEDGFERDTSLNRGDYQSYLSELSRLQASLYQGPMHKVFANKLRHNIVEIDLMEA